MAFYPKAATYTTLFKMISSSDHISLKTTATPSVNISKSGNTFIKAAGTVTEVGSGWYKIVLTPTDTNTAGDLAFYCTGQGADDTDFRDQVMDIATMNLGVNVTNWNMTQVATPATAGVPDINVKNYNNQTATTDANNLPNVNTQDYLGAVLTALTVAGRPDVNVTRYNNQTATADANGMPNVNVRDWNAQVVTSLPSGFLTTTFPAGTVASTTNITSATGVTLAAVAPVNVTQWNGQTATYDSNKFPNVNVSDWLSLAPLALSAQQVQAVVPSSTVVASVSGAVGSVTGNVGGNVVGSVGSVTGNVGGNVVGSVGSVATAVFMNSNLKKNTAVSNFLFLITDATNHLPATGAASLTPTRAIDGGAFGAGTLSAVTEIAAGWYSINFGAGDLNGNNIAFRCTSTNNDDVDLLLVTTP